MLTNILQDEIPLLKQQLHELTKENETLYLFNSTLYLTLDLHCIIQDANFQASLFLGCERQWLLKTSFLNYLTPESLFLFQNTIETALKTQFKQMCEIEILLKPHQKRVIHVETTLLPHALIRISLADITNLQKLTTQVLELEKSLTLGNQLIQYANDAIAALSHELYIKIVTPTFCELFSRAFSTPIKVDMNLNVILADYPNTREEINFLCQEALLYHKKTLVLEHPNNQSDAYYYYEITSHAFYNNYAKKNEFILCAKDLTTYKLNDAYQHQQQTKLAIASNKISIGEISSIFAHEITQPLTAILAYSHSCLLTLKNNHEKKSALSTSIEHIVLQAKHINHIILNMKNLTLDTATHTEETNVNSLIQETLAILNYEILDSHLIISLKLMTNPPPILVNKIHIMQVILNLARNSIDALQGTATLQPTLTIHTRVCKDEIIVEIQDNGPGIPDAVDDKIFYMHYTTKSQGTGIGLAVSRSIIEAHGGTLRLQKNKQPGACFTFTLPIKAG